MVSSPAETPPFCLSPTTQIFSYTDETELKLIALRRIDGHAASSPRLDFSNRVMQLYAGYLVLIADMEPKMSDELKARIYHWQDNFRRHLEMILLIKDIARHIKPSMTPEELHAILQKQKSSNKKIFPKPRLSPLMSVFDNALSNSEMVNELWQNYVNAVRQISDLSSEWLIIYSLFKKELPLFKREYNIDDMNDGFIFTHTALENSMYLVENPAKLIRFHIQAGDFFRKWYTDAFQIFQTHTFKDLDLKSFIRIRLQPKLDLGDMYLDINDIIMESMLNNLLGNAIKYRNTKKPMVEISFDVNFDSHEKKHYLVITVKNSADIDTGNDLSKNPMHLVNNKKLGFHYVFTTKGTGVGLSEFYQSARQFGYKADIRYEESPKHGTLFVAELKIPFEVSTDDMVLLSA